jgi:hypothetical protein
MADTNTTGGDEAPAPGEREREILSLAVIHPDLYEKAQPELERLIGDRLQQEPADAKPVAKEEPGKDAAPAEPGPRERELLALMTTDPKRYASKEVQAEIAELAKARAAGKGKAEPAKKAEAEGEDDEPTGNFVPEDASGYAVPAPPAELGERSTTEVEMINTALSAFHDAGLTKAQASVVLAELDRANLAATQAAADRALEGQERTVATLKAQWPHDYAERIESVNELFREHLSAYMPNRGDRQDLLDTLMADGTRLGDNLPFVLALADLAQSAGRRPGRRSSGDPPPRRQPLDGRSDAGLEAEKARIMALMHTDEAAYKAAQPELERIITALNKRRK